MTQVLVVECSARKEGSYSRQLVSELLTSLKARGVHQVVFRDLAAEPIPILQDGVVQAIRTRPADLTPEQHAGTALSEQLIAELKAADLIIIGSPMYNWSIPAALKAYLDQVVRIGLTFDYGANGAEGLLRGKRALVIMARGGTYKDPARAALNFQEPYLRQILRVVGLEPEFIAVEGTLMGDAVLKPSLEHARNALGRFAETVG